MVDNRPKNSYRRCITMDITEQKNEDIRNSKTYRSAVAGSSDAQLEVGCKFYKNGNEFEAFEFLKMSAENGNPEAMNKIGYIYFHGIVSVKDITLAAFWWSKGAQLGSEKARNNLLLLK
ncbi:MAG: SEL1-like repeat protein [Desulfuromonadaceae bacterium]|nr:SEL1-like repeat protein [Desulfuromonadaceae bacterium]